LFGRWFFVYPKVLETLILIFRYDSSLNLQIICGVCNSMLQCIKKYRKEFINAKISFLVMILLLTMLVSGCAENDDTVPVADEPSEDVVEEVSGKDTNLALFPGSVRVYFRRVKRASWLNIGSKLLWKM